MGKGATLHRGASTSNMSLMSVTLDVSVNSIFWLNVCASCRGARAGQHTVRGELRAGRRQAGGDEPIVVHAACA